MVKIFAESEKRAYLVYFASEFYAMCGNENGGYGLRIFLDKCHAPCRTVKGRKGIDGSGSDVESKANMSIRSE